jgi:hypothetical protein
MLEWSGNEPARETGTEYDKRKEDQIEAVSRGRVAVC